MTKPRVTPPTPHNYPTVLDLFAGCGGFSLGMERAGFRTIAAVDVDPNAVSTYKKNLPEVMHVLERDLIAYQPEDLSYLLGRQTVDVIVGGPPCQGFSNVRKVDGANHGDRLINDPRRYLYKDFLRFVAYFRPKVFVMENVLGIRTAAGGEFLTRVHSEARALGYRVHGQEVKAWQFGVPQKRVRQLIIGTRGTLPIFERSLLNPTHSDPGSSQDDRQEAVPLWEAIGDLPALRAGDGNHEAKYDMSRRRRHLKRYSSRFLYSVLQVLQTTKLTNHVARPHSDRDLRDFARLREGESSAAAMRDRKVAFEWPYSKEHFKDRYTRQHRARLCSTIVAHLSKDGLMFIHPTQRRSLTPREAARIQSFPDWFVFPSAQTHAFRLIGNAVPPLVGEAVGLAIKNYLVKSDQQVRGQIRTKALPIDEALSLTKLLLAAAKNGKLKSLSIDEFRSAWFAVGYACPFVHPDGLLENGRTVGSDCGPLKDNSLHQVLKPYYLRSGWPVCLVAVGIEARRRFGLGQLSHEEFYFSSAQLSRTNPVHGGTDT